jgi:hypothetical protein
VPRDRPPDAPQAGCTAAIARLVEERSGATRSRVLEEVSRLAFSTIGAVLEVKDGQLIVKDHADLDADVLSTIASVEESVNERGFRTLRVKQHDRLAALSLLAKILGMANTSKLELSGPNGAPMQLDHRVATARERIAAKLDAIASRGGAALPAPSESPMMIDITPTRAEASPSAVLAGWLQGAGERE